MHLPPRSIRIATTGGVRASAAPSALPSCATVCAGGCALRCCADVADEQLPPGWYLIGARPGIVERRSPQLTREVIGLVSAVERQSPHARGRLVRLVICATSAPSRAVPRPAGSRRRARPTPSRPCDVHGTLRGLCLTLRRLLRCRPFGPSGLGSGARRPVILTFSRSTKESGCLDDRLALFEYPARLLAWFYDLTNNYILAISMIALVVMLITAPLQLKATKGMLEMQKLQPELRKLQQEHRGDRQKLNEEMMKLYQEHKVNPLASCFPLLLQFPVFIIMFQVLHGLTREVNCADRACPRCRAICGTTRRARSSTPTS